MSESVIELKNISKRFGDREILKGVCLRIFTSETISIVGASGTGKTTLLNILSLLESPDEGEVFWGDVPVLKISPRMVPRLRGEKFGCVFQNHNLITELSVLENVLLPIKISSFVKKSDTEHAEELLNKVGLLDRKDSRIEHLSGGEKQRIAVIRALVRRPQVILADEPTGNLDETNSRGVVDLMLELCQSIGSSLILITHNNELSRLTEKRYLLSDGRLIQQQEDGL